MNAIVAEFTSINNIQLSSGKIIPESVHAH